MAKVKRTHNTNTSKCRCSKCGTETNSTIGKKHRKCPGSKGQENPGQHRGTWERA